MLTHVEPVEVPVLRQLNPDARALADFMSELSEEAYCAGWMGGLEFVLWKALVGGPRSYGRLEITDEQLKPLMELSEAAKGWIVFDDVEEETLVPLDEWEQRFERWSPR